MDREKKGNIMATIRADRLKKLQTMRLLAGDHKSVGEGLCAMEAAAWLAGEPHSSTPRCVCPVIAAFLRSWNDAIADDDERTAIIRPLVTWAIGTRSTKQVEKRRALMAIDWSVRTFTPEWLDLCNERYAVHTSALRSLPAITSFKDLIAAVPILAHLKKQAASARLDAMTDTATWDDFRDSAWESVSASGVAAFKDAAMTGAWDDASSSAFDDVWNEVLDDAWDAADSWDIAWDAASAAALDDAKNLAQIKGKLQASAAELVRRMCEA